MVDSDSSSPARPLELAVTGTGTGVGKTRVMGLLVPALRSAGRRVWLHKPVACGGWDGATADDGRALTCLAGDGQDPATVCPLQFPEPASPHLAAAAAGVAVPSAGVRERIRSLRGVHDLLIEGAGGLLSPLAEDRATLADLLVGTGIPLLVVTTPELGTLNATALTVDCARSRGLAVLGLVLNRPAPTGDTLATRCAAAELAACCGVPVLAEFLHGADDAHGLASRLLDPAQGGGG